MNSNELEREIKSMLQKVVIIGACPAGLLLAHYLLRRGKYCVELYEQRSDPRLADGTTVVDNN